jgi:hypothetical protein
MRGGAIPVLAWGCILGVLFAGNWVWTGDPTQVGEFGFAVGLVLLCGVSLSLVNRSAVRRGPPPQPPPERTEQIPELSYGAFGAALALAAIVFGLAFGHFLIYFGAGLFALSIGRVVAELRAARATTRRHLQCGHGPGHPRAGEAARQARSSASGEDGERA